LRKQIKSERKSDASLKQLNAFEKKIVSAKKEYKKLNQEIGRLETTSGSQDETESYANHSHAKKNRKEMKTEELREFSSSSEKVGDDEESTENYGNESTSSGKETLEERLNILSALLKTKDDEIHEIGKKIQELSSHKNLDQKTADQISIELKIKCSEIINSYNTEFKEQTDIQKIINKNTGVICDTEYPNVISNTIKKNN
jgi:hypothetical protein